MDLGPLDHTYHSHAIAKCSAVEILHSVIVLPMTDTKEFQVDRLETQELSSPSSVDAKRLTKRVLWKLDIR